MSKSLLKNYTLTNLKPKNYIYLIQEASHRKKDIGCVKIGVAANIELRLQALQIGNPRKLSLIGKIGPYSRTKAEWLEKTYHKRLKKFHIRGEWFNHKCISEMSAVI